MKIKEVLNDEIRFDNGRSVRFQFEARLIPYLPVMDIRKIDKNCFDIDFVEESICFEEKWDEGITICDMTGNKYTFTVYKEKNPYFDQKYYDCITDQARMSEEDFDWELCGNAQLEQVTITYDNRPMHICNFFSFTSDRAPYFEVESNSSCPMRVVDITEKYIQFSNGKKITYNHMPDCCEYNYADFLQIDDVGKETIYYESELVFEVVENYGFRFGNKNGIMTFVPCYSSQSGYYTCELDIYYDEKLVIHLHHTQENF